MPIPYQPNHSYWLSEIELQPTAALSGDIRVDVALVGGGYTGLVCALFLKRLRPDLKVAVLESHYVGFGASGRNAGMVLHELHSDRAARFGKNAVRFTYEQVVGAVDTIDRLCKDYGFDCELERNGYLELALCPAHFKRLAERERTFKEYGQPLRVLDRSAMQREIRSPAFWGALLYPHAAALQPAKYVLGLKKAILQEGVQLYEGTPVLSLLPGERVVLTTPQGKVQAGAVVLGLNAYHPASDIRPLHNRVVSLFSFIVLTEPLGARIEETLGWGKRWGYSDMRHLHNYVRPVADRLLFGGRVRYRFGTYLPPEQELPMYEQLKREFSRNFPMLQDVRFTHQWCGSVDFNWRRSPIMGVAGKHRNLYYSMGYSGMGVSLATLGGQVLADLYLGKRDRWEGLIYLNDAQWPLPPEPFKFLGFTGKYWWMLWQDWLDGRSLRATR